MKASELRKKNPQQLRDELKELLREQFNLRMQKGMGQVPKPHLFNKVQRDIARINTILNEKA